MKEISKICFLALVLSLLLSGCAAKQQHRAEVPSERSSFNLDWQMLKGNFTLETISDAEAKLWTLVRLPHDWAIDKAPQKGQYMKNYGHYPLPGTYWYKKTFELPSGDQGKEIYLDFEGAMQDATVYLNGEQVGRWPNGYASFQADLTDLLKYGEGQTNELLVHLDLPLRFTRWYTGAGIYRNVWLVKQDPVHFAHNGIFVTTPEVSDASALVDVQMELESEADYSGEGMVEVSIIDSEGNSVAHGELSVSLTAGELSTISTQLKLSDPKRWDITSPYLYEVVAQLSVDGEPKDAITAPLGVRTLRFDADEGFFLNGRHVKIYGACQHHDLGPLGTAFNLRAAERQLEILREMGCNAIRTAHNIPAPGLLDLCDRMGFLVMNESFDMWKIPKGKHDQGYSPKYWDDWWRKDVEAFVKRDRNHPSIFMWSSGNEIPEQKQKDGAILCQAITDEFHKYDTTRPVTAGFNDTHQAVDHGLIDAVDVVGWNYATKYGDWYNEFHAMPEHKNKLQIATETVSNHSSRGYYRFPYGEPQRNGPELQACSYTMRAPGYALPGDKEIMYQATSPSVMGEFIWTGFDYIGEPWPYPEDSTLSYYGVIDLCGFPKDIFYTYQTAWRPDYNTIHIFPHWNWQGREGEQTPIQVFTNGDEAELFVNGQSHGKRRKGEGNTVVKSLNKFDAGEIADFPNRMIWEDVYYQPGEVKVIAWKDGVQIAEKSIETTGPVSGLRLSADRETIRADYEALSFITIDAVDAAGRFVPTFAEALEVTVEGAGELVALGSGNPADFTAMQGGNRYKAFYGKALAIVRGKDGQPGEITVHVKGIPGQVSEIDDNDPQLEYDGGWKLFTSKSDGRTEHFANLAGATAKLSFTGNRAQVYGYTRAKAGILQVKLNGQLVKEVDCYSEQTDLDALLFDSGELPQGTHTLEIVGTGRKNAASTHHQVNLDRFVVYDPASPAEFEGASITIATE